MRRVGSICDLGATCLAQALAGNRSLTVLTLSNANITHTGCAVLCASLSLANRTLVSINLSGNPLSARGATSLGAMLRRNVSLRVLEVEDCGLGPAKGIARAITDSPRPHGFLLFGPILCQHAEAMGLPASAGLEEDAWGNAEVVGFVWGRHASLLAAFAMGLLPGAGLASPVRAFEHAADCLVVVASQFWRGGAPPGVGQANEDEDEEDEGWRLWFAKGGVLGGDVPHMRSPYSSLRDVSGTLEWHRHWSLREEGLFSVEMWDAAAMWESL